MDEEQERELWREAIARGWSIEYPNDLRPIPEQRELLGHQTVREAGAAERPCDHPTDDEVG